MIKLIVGLSNPGKKYKYTRHNVGSWYVEHLAKKYNKKFKFVEKIMGKLTKLEFRDIYIYLLIPHIFMNINGYSVFNFKKYYKIKTKEILIVHDDLNLVPGEFKFKFGVNFNSHNGLKNVIQHLNYKTNFYNLRIGIGRPKKKEKISDFVLNIPDVKDFKYIQQSIVKSIDYLLEILN